MSEDKPATPPKRANAWVFVLGLLGLLGLVDLLVAGVSAAPVDAGITDADALEARLDALVAESASASSTEPWLMLGDSVLVGDTGKDELPRWSEHRLIDNLRRELAVDERARFEQVALSGMVPVDMLAILAALDVRDPEGRVSVLVELSPRYFSAAYAGSMEHSRPWLAQLDADVATVDDLRRRLRRVTPVLRHRGRFAAIRERLAGPSADTSVIEDELRERGDRLEAFARLSVHYRDLVVTPESAQVEALLALVEACRARGRKLVLFTTPLEDRFVAELGTKEHGGAWLAQLDALIRPDGREVALLPMDHPLFASPLFWDHVHLRPEGHRLLAINLLAQMGLGLDRVPPATELIGRAGIDASLVAGVARGSSEGAGWQARFDEPRGLAVARGGARVVIADTNNHVLRELHGDLRVVSTLAGAAGEAGSADGPAHAARLDRPRAPVILEDGAVVFADADGARLRALRGGQVSTLAAAELGEGWAIEVLRARGENLVALERAGDRTRIVARTLDGGSPKTWVLGADDLARRLVAFALHPEVGIYFATASGQIFFARDLDAPLDLARADPRAQLIYANVGEDVIPKPGERFPISFESLRLSEIHDLVYVERYAGLLVQDYAPHGVGAYENPITERAHLRFLDLEAGVVYPWLKPLVVGTGQLYQNEDTGGVSSYYHEGALALEQGSATLFYLESDRSRLIRLEDGMLGVAKIGTFTKSRLGNADVLGNEAGTRALEDHDPLRFLDRSLANDPAMDLGGPYQLLVLGSSMTSMSELVGDYSLGRALIAALERELALRDRVRLHGFQRTVPGGRLTRDIPLLKRFMRNGARPDLIVIDANGSTFMPDDADDAFMDEQLERMAKLAQRWDSKLVFLDTAPYIVRNREPPRPTLPRVQRFLELAEARGFDVIRVDARILDANLEVAPMAQPPVTGIHAPPWAIDRLAEEFAAALAPIVRAWLRGREPALRALAPQSAEDARARRLAEAFTEVDGVDWAAVLPELPLEAVQVDTEASELVAFIDLARLPPELAEAPDLEALILACIHARAVQHRDGSRRARVSVGRFEAYDEYGAGVDRGATILAREVLDFDGLVEYATAFAER